MRKILVTVSVLLLIGFCLSSCSSGPPARSQQAVSQGGAVTQLKPAVTVPAECHTTPVWSGQSPYTSVSSGIPWLKAEPSSSSIAGYLFFSGPELARVQKYRPLHTGGKFPDGGNTKILWVIGAPDASGSIEITGKKLSAPQETIRQDFPVASAGYPSILNIPTPGCWQVLLKSGSVSGTVTFWVVNG